IGADVGQCDQVPIRFDAADADFEAVVSCARVRALRPRGVDETVYAGHALGGISIGTVRQRLLMKARRAVNVQRALRGWLAAVTWPTSVRAQVDVDPYSFL
ncbi:MAG: hypothetical protein V3U23_00105, partial [Kiloniellales bacterium]